jgi:spermidine synthase
MNVAYPLFPVSVITILAYFTTWLFTKWEIFPLRTHRKFWNYLLLITFLVSGIIGLLSVIKINYKLEIPHYDQLLKWHVAFGIAMVVIALFHLSWHLKYYFSRSAKISKKLEKPAIEFINKGVENIGFLLFMLGMVAIIDQVVFIREFLSVLDGNEQVLGIVMAVWLLLTAWGAYTGRIQNSLGFNLQKGLNLLAFLALAPAFLIGLLYWLKSMLFPPGTITNMGMSVAGVFLLLFPVCFLSGYLFTALSTHFSLSKNENLIGKAYAFESLGSLAGGLIFSLILGRFFNSLQIIGLTSEVVLLVVALNLTERKTLKRISLFGASILIPLLIFLFNPDVQIKKLFYPNQEIILDQSTRYGNLVVTRQSGQLNFYENNSLQFYTDNLTLSEEVVHFAMVQHVNPKQVLLLSGGISGMLKEIKKYPVEKITYLEPNPEIFGHWKNLSKANDDLSRVEFVNSDIRSFLKRTKTIYDVVLINLPPPSTLGFNRFYTEEFFSSIKNHCNSGSVVCTSLPSTMNYAEENALEVNSSLWKTLGSQFSNMMLLQGEKNYFLASESQLSMNITELISKEGIVNEYVNSNYIDDELVAQRSQTLVSQFNPAAKINRDFYPFMFIKQITHWLNFVGASYKVLVIIPALLFLLLFFKLNPITTGIYTGGFTAASLEVTLMLAYQVFFGSLYLASALFFSVFMGGLALGSHLKLNRKRKSNLKSYSVLQFFLALFSLLIPDFVYLIGKILAPGLMVQFLFFIPLFVLAFGIGYEFNLASTLQPYGFSKTSGINYSADLAGSAFGAFLTAILLLPVCGLVVTCMVVAVLNLFSGLRVVLQK